MAIPAPEITLDEAISAAMVNIDQLAIINTPTARSMRYYIDAEKNFIARRGVSEFCELSRPKTIIDVSVVFHKEVTGPIFRELSKHETFIEYWDAEVWEETESPIENIYGTGPVWPNGVGPRTFIFVGNGRHKYKFSVRDYASIYDPLVITYKIRE